MVVYRYLLHPLLSLPLHVGQLLLEAVDPAKVTLSLLLQDPDPHQVLPTLLTSHLLNNKRCQVILTQNRRFKQI